MTKYKTCGWKIAIEEVEVERETDTTVWIKGRAIRKRSHFDNYFDTREEAKQFLIDKETENVERHKNALQKSRSALGQAQSL